MTEADMMLFNVDDYVNIFSDSSTYAYSPSGLLCADPIGLYVPQAPPPSPMNKEDSSDSGTLQSLSQWDKIISFLNEAPALTPTHDGGFSSRKFNIPGTDEAVHCVAWSQRHYITQAEVFKILEALVRTKEGIQVSNSRLGEGLHSILRQLKKDEHYIVRPSSNAFKKWLLKRGLIIPSGRQRIYFWKKLDFSQLEKEVLKRLERLQGTASRTPKKTVSHATSRPFDPSLRSPEDLVTGSESSKNHLEIRGTSREPSAVTLVPLDEMPRSHVEPYSDYCKAASLDEFDLFSDYFEIGA